MRTFPNETISLDWVQQLPDNLEGDYYLLFNILETGQNFSLQNTPTITLTSFNEGITMMVDTNGTNSNIERPSTSIDGKIVAYEATDEGIRHIYYRDLRAEPPTTIQITQGASASSFRPKNEILLRNRRRLPLETLTAMRIYFITP